jgi:YD repeat-containing protein
MGRMLSATQNGIIAGFTYDALGRQLSQTLPIASIATPTFTSEYDLAGRRTKLTWPVDASSSTAYYANYDYLVTGEMKTVTEKGMTAHGPYMEYVFVFGPPLVAAGAAATPEGVALARTAAMNPTSKLFARGTGRLNSNNFLRMGQGWKGSATSGRAVFRISIGHRSWTPIPGLPTFPWHIP